MRDCVARLRRGSIVTSRSYITGVCCVSCLLIDRLVQVDAKCVHACVFLFLRVYIHVVARTNSRGDKFGQERGVARL